jgi:hypothetical protein
VIIDSIFGQIDPDMYNYPYLVLLYLLVNQNDISFSGCMQMTLKCIYTISIFSNFFQIIHYFFIRYTQISFCGYLPWTLKQHPPNIITIHPHHHHYQKGSYLYKGHNLENNLNTFTFFIFQRPFIFGHGPCTSVTHCQLTISLANSRYIT